MALINSASKSADGGEQNSRAYRVTKSFGNAFPKAKLLNKSKTIAHKNQYIVYFVGPKKVRKEVGGCVREMNSDAVFQALHVPYNLSLSNWSLSLNLSRVFRREVEKSIISDTHSSSSDLRSLWNILDGGLTRRVLDTVFSRSKTSISCRAEFFLAKNFAGDTWSKGYEFDDNARAESFWTGCSCSFRPILRLSETIETSGWNQNSFVFQNLFW